MPHYETVLILRQDLSTSQAESIAAQTQQDLKQAKATIERTESWGLRTLAYPIRKNRKGHYFLINHSNESQTTQEMQRILRLNEDLLRILTIKTALPQTQPTPIAAAQAQRDQEPAPPHRTGYGRTNDARTTYTRTNDARTTYARTTYARTTDTKTTDTKTTDARTTDARTNDTKTTDTKTTDARTNDARTNDAKTTDTKTTETQQDNPPNNSSETNDSQETS